MSHSICKYSEGFYCTKCGALEEDLRSELCKAAIHEELEKRDIEVKKLGTQTDIEVKKLGTQRLLLAGNIGAYWNIRPFI